MVRNPHPSRTTITTLSAGRKKLVQVIDDDDQDRVVSVSDTSYSVGIHLNDQEPDPNKERG